MVVAVLSCLSSVCLNSGEARAEHHALLAHDTGDVACFLFPVAPRARMGAYVSDCRCVFGLSAGSLCGSRTRGADKTLHDRTANSVLPSKPQPQLKLHSCLPLSHTLFWMSCQCNQVTQSDYCISLRP